MLPDEKSNPETNLRDSQYYFNRELSWLEFNYRVLHEALDSRTPLLERLKFTAIFSSNLDEFFMIRVSTLKGQVEAGVAQLTPDGRTPQQQLEEIEQRLRSMVAKQHENFEQQLRPQLAALGVKLLNYADLNQEQSLYCQRYFEKQVFPILTPLGVDPGHPFPHISNLSFNVAVVVKNPKTEEERFARVKVPDILPRFIELPQELQQFDEGQKIVWMGIPLEQVIAHNLSSLFPGLEIQEYGFFRITRDADFPIQDEADDLLLAIQQEIGKRYFKGFAVRLELQASASALVRESLMGGLNIGASDVYEVQGLMHLGALMSFLALPLPEYKDAPWQPVVPPRLRAISQLARAEDLENINEGNDFFSLIRYGDILLHHPYESFSDSVELFITQAALDPDVLAIKMTLYRTSGDSPIIKALMAAAAARKQVVALVELKARFDEENNIIWARKLEDAGVHVVYGLVGLKTHTKIFLVVRREGEEIRRYFHIGTGNYNFLTAKLYTDLGLLSCREALGADLSELFNFLTGYSQQQTYRKLLIAPVNLRESLLAMIRREIEHSHQGRSGKIIAKMNALVDPEIIAALYEASQAGVQIDLVIRGICCLRPGLSGVSENIRVISIVGRYLEHSRIFYFQNDGESEIYLGSADWMPRNLDRRVEGITPVEEPSLVNKLKEILEILLQDNRYAWELQADGTYIQRHPQADESERSAQNIFMDMALQTKS
ncbi:MAG: polyphosphate kinase 1 [Xenococcaceae cyanobacterium MO_234.B1]|nr:polyphosphate kinase 1 [Xenococcaceae cyanobacterium MO_234.B1]